MNSLKERLARLAEWYESGPKHPKEFEEGRQRIAADIREAMAHIRDHADFAKMHREMAASEPREEIAAAHIRFAEAHELAETDEPLAKATPGSTGGR